MERFINNLNYITGICGTVFLVGVVGFRLHQIVQIKDGAWVSFAISDALSVLLALLFGLIYFLSRISVSKELLIAKALFPSGRIPNEFSYPNDRYYITAAVFSFLCFYMLLIWFANNIQLSSMMMFAVAVIDLRTRYLINKGYLKIFTDPKYAPSAVERGFQEIQDRRAVATWYLFQLPHLWKEAVRIAGCGVAAALAILGYISPMGRLDLLAYVFLIGTLTINEIITQRWRFERDRRFNALAAKLLSAIYERTHYADSSVSVSDLGPSLALSDGQARAAWRYLSELGLIKNYSAPYSGRINESGAHMMEKARREPQQPINLNFFGPVSLQNLEVGQMQNSVIQQAGAQSTLSQSISFNRQDLDDVRQALELLEKYINDLGLNDAAKRKALALVATLNAQLADDPDPVIFKQAGRSLRNIIEGVIAGLVASGIQPPIWSFIDSVFKRLFGG